jgi:hypothetical protein
MYVLISLDIQYLMGFSTFIMTCKVYSKCNLGDTSRKELKACGTNKLSLAVSVTARQ